MSDQPHITPQTSMRDVLAAYPGAQRALFRKYHIGGCSSCGFSPEETLTGLCQRNNNLDVAAVIAQIQASHAEDQKILVQPRQLADWLATGQQLKLLDIRTREEWEAARIEPSILFTQETLQEMLGRWNRQVLIVIYDHVGNKSMDAAAYFLGHGFTNVRALQGGLDAWSQSIDPKVPRYRLETA